MSNVNDTLKEREKIHGDFQRNSHSMQALKRCCVESDNWYQLENYQKESIEMICHKLGRILCGNPNHLDHWHDIAGYATLVENILSRNKDIVSKTET